VEGEGAAQPRTGEARPPCPRFARAGFAAESRKGGAAVHCINRKVLLETVPKSKIPINNSQHPIRQKNISLPFEIIDVEPKKSSKIRINRCNSQKKRV
jgi:hypothetical protein